MWIRSLLARTVGTFQVCVVLAISVLALSVAGGLLAMLVVYLTTFDGSTYGKEGTNTFVFGAVLVPLAPLVLWALSRLLPDAK